MLNGPVNGFLTVFCRGAVHHTAPVSDQLVTAGSILGNNSIEGNQNDY
jgi:hypothetical protein